MNEQALRKLFNDIAPRRFQLGQLDCVRFVVDAVYAGWGRDYRDQLHYQDRRSAVAQLRKSGGLKDSCIEAMGELWPMENLQAGDVVWFDEPVGTIGLLMPNYIAVKTHRQIVRVPIDSRMMGWQT